MTINQLRYVVEVAKASSINRAAANLFVSQSVVSTAITSLEKEIGHIIFVRSNRGVSLTPFGHTFISYVSSIQAQLQQLDSLIQRDFVQHEFHLSVASSGYYFLSRICAELFERYRSMGIRVEQYEDHENNVADLVDSQIAEIGIVRMWSCYKNGYIKQLRSRKLQYYTVADLNVAVTVGPKSPLFHRESDYITAEELRDQPAVMYSNMDSGPYADIYRRLQIPKGASRFVISTRSAIYEVLSNTGCYYLNSAYPFEVLDVGRPSNYSEYRTLYLENCGISSEIAWIKREDYVMSQLANEVVNSVAYYFA
jgi:DNA-binding transcriptional LysR family regulator